MCSVGASCVTVGRQRKLLLCRGTKSASQRLQSFRKTFRHDEEIPGARNTNLHSSLLNISTVSTRMRYALNPGTLCSGVNVGMLSAWESFGTFLEQSKLGELASNTSNGVTLMRQPMNLNIGRTAAAAPEDSALHPLALRLTATSTLESGSMPRCPRRLHRSVRLAQPCSKDCLGRDQSSSSSYRKLSTKTSCQSIRI